MSARRGSSRGDFDSLAIALFAELSRLLPDGVPDNSGFSFAVEPEQALAALRALPDGAGEAAVLRALGHDPDDYRRLRNA